MVDTSQGPEEFESSFPVFSEKWASVSPVTPEDTGWYHVPPLFPWSWVLDRQKPSLEHTGIYGKDRFPWTGKELLIAEVWVSMPLP